MRSSLLLALRIFIKKIGLAKPAHISFELEGQNAADHISDLIKSKEPFMLARFGSTELSALVGSKNQARKGWAKYRDYILSITSAVELKQSHISRLKTLSGVFPEDRELVERFYKLYVQDAKELDILASWRHEEAEILEVAQVNPPRIPLSDLEPYLHSNPWSKALEGKKVLVIHPFAFTIMNQYQNFEKLFEDPKILPKFELKTFKAVQTVAGEEHPEYKNWFEALNYMKTRIKEIDFDIAIIGCGAYGFPLAAEIKRMGKQAVHMGGATQLLFGIKGKRWDDHEIIGKLYNENWVRPDESERPKQSNLVEDSCYW